MWSFHCAPGYALRVAQYGMYRGRQEGGAAMAVNCVVAVWLWRQSQVRKLAIVTYVQLRTYRTVSERDLIFDTPSAVATVVEA